MFKGILSYQGAISLGSTLKYITFYNYSHNVFIWAGLAVFFDSEKYNKGRFKVMDTYLQLLYNFEPTFLY